MAARLEAVPSVQTLDLVDLRRLSSAHLESLLDEETRTWQEQLDWDFQKSADLVRRFVDLRALSGYALMDGGQAAGYVYFVLEEHKGLIGDLYIRRAFHTIENEDRLLTALLESMIGASQVKRIESQLMMIMPDPARRMPGWQYLNTYGRNFMLLDFESAPTLAERPAPRKIYLEKWSDHHTEGSAQLIAGAYASHIDSRINDQYRSVNGARRFLYNIVQYPGCGSFFRPASFVAFDMRHGWMCGMSLASVVGNEAGHITQICVAPAVRGTGVGYELLRESLACLREHGCRKVSLTVTSANHEAVQLYERVGFRTVRKFSAYVWEGFSSA